MSITEYDDGDEIIAATTLADENGNPVTPAALYFMLQWGDEPSATTLVYGVDAEIVRDDEGAYSAHLDSTGHGFANGVSVGWVRAQWVAPPGSGQFSERWVNAYVRAKAVTV